MLLTRNNTSVSWSGTAEPAKQVNFAMPSTCDYRASIMNLLLRAHILTATESNLEQQRRLKWSSHNWATGAGSYCCIINGLTSTVCAETNHTATIMRSEKLALNITRVGLEPSDAVKCICFGVLVEYNSKRSERPSPWDKTKENLTKKFQRTLTLNSLRKNDAEIYTKNEMKSHSSSIRNHNRGRRP